MRTCAFNKAHRRLRRRVAGSRLLRAVYDVGSVSGVAGMVFGYYVIYSTLFASASSPSPSKRSVSVHPIIPGITTPLPHLPVILFCLLLCQVIHELGHAVAAAVENIPLLHAGISLSSAFVALPPLAPRCSPLAQLRIIAAGPFHNLLTFLLLAALPSLAPLLPSTDLSPLGALVLAVAPHSVLRPYLPTGTIITHLDDYPLFNASLADPWSSYLLAPQPAPLSPYDSPPDTLPLQGWCLPSPQFLNAPSSCCDRSPNPNTPPDPSSHLVCFDALPPPNTLTHQSRCIDPIPILSQPPLPPYPSLSPQPHPQPQTPYTRCSSPRDCAGLQDTDADAYVCALPRPAEHLLRITILAPNTYTQLEGQEEDTMRLQTLLWTGPRREIYDQVHTTQHLPFPYPTLPTKQTNTSSMHNRMLRTYTLLAPGARLLYTYTSLASLSLYTLNLLPLPRLDGLHFLGALFALLSPLSPLLKSLLKPLKPLLNLLSPFLKPLFNLRNLANLPYRRLFTRRRGGRGRGRGDGDAETLLPLYNPSSSQHQLNGHGQPNDFTFTFAVPRAGPSSSSSHSYVDASYPPSHSPRSPSYNDDASHSSYAHNIANSMRDIGVDIGVDTDTNIGADGGESDSDTERDGDVELGLRPPLHPSSSQSQS